MAAGLTAQGRTEECIDTCFSYSAKGCVGVEIAYNSGEYVCVM